MTEPSTHLTWAELACADGTPYPEALRSTRGLEVAALFEAIRALCGHQPIVVTSAYRTPAHNRKIGGAPDSQHMQGRALDLKPPAGMTVAEFYRRIWDARDALPKLGAVGRYRAFVHVDTRPRAPGQRVAHWNGGAQRKDDRS
jgi:uncharacterized protein YcbK (DUF882 family)